MKSVVEWIGVPAALGICTAVLFVPDSVAEKLRLVALRENHGMWFGLLFALTAALLLRSVLAAAWAHARERLKRVAEEEQARAACERIEKVLESLSEEEGAVLLYAHSEGGTLNLGTLGFSLGGGSGIPTNAVHRLEALGLLEVRGRGSPFESCSIPDEHFAALTALIEREQRSSIAKLVAREKQSRAESAPVKNQSRRAA